MAAQLCATAAPAQPAANVPGEPDQAPPLTEDVFHLPVEEKLATEINALVAALSSPLYEEREVAGARLNAIGLQTLGELRRSFRTTKNFELRLAIEEVVRQAFLNHHVFDRNGFLGIVMQPFSKVNWTRQRDRYWKQKYKAQEKPRDPKTPPTDTVGVIITSVTPDTGASRAALLPLDIILAVDGVQLTGEGAQLNSALSRAIRSHRPGEQIVLDIWREGREISVTVTLGRAPDATVRATTTTSGGVSGTTALYRQVVAKLFPEWWMTHFLDPQQSSFEQD